MTVTFGDVEVDKHVLDALDFDTALPCEFRSRPECTDAVEYVLTMKCCATTYLNCEAHMLFSITNWGKHNDHHTRACTTCNKVLSSKIVPWIVTPFKA